MQSRYHVAGFVASLRCSSSNVDKVLPDCLNFINEQQHYVMLQFE